MVRKIALSSGVAALLLGVLTLTQSSPAPRVASEGLERFSGRDELLSHSGRVADGAFNRAVPWKSLALCDAPAGLFVLGRGKERFIPRTTARTGNW